MQAPEGLETLIDYGIIQKVVRPLMSGKEAHVFVVLVGGEECVAKVYKEATQRTFKHRSVYTEGRRTRNTRDQRAMSKRSQHGRKKDEDAWRSTEVDMIYRLRDAGVRVPEPINFVEGVLVMELVKDGDGHAAPRLGDLTYSPGKAREIYQTLIREVVRMLCAGVIHGDLSDFNVLMTEAGPVVIDFPQAVDPTLNPNSKKLFLRDVENLNRFLARFAPEEPVLPYGEEIWSLFEANRLRPDTKLRGHYDAPKGKADTDEVMSLIEEARDENLMRRGVWDKDDLEDEDLAARAPVRGNAPFRRVVDFSEEKPRKALAKEPVERKPAARTRGAQPTRRRRANVAERTPPAGTAADAAAKSEASPSRRRRRRGGKSYPEVGTVVREPAGKNDSPKVDAARPRDPETPRRRRSRKRRAAASADASAPPKKEPAKRSAESQPSPERNRSPRKDTGSGRPPGRRRRRPGKASPEK